MRHVGISSVFLLFMAFVVVQRLVETFARRPTIKGELVLRWSFPALMVVHALIFLGSIAEFFLVPRSLNYWLCGVGFLLYVGSLVLRNVAIRTLGRFWSLQIEIRQEHHLVTEGVYSLVRHPAYLAVILELTSVPLVANAFYTLLVTAVVYLPLLLWRLQHEETALLAKFGDRYQVYQRDVGQLLPRWPALCRVLRRGRRWS